MKRKVGITVAAAALLVLAFGPRIVRAQMKHAAVVDCAMMDHGGPMGHGAMMSGPMGGMSPLPIFLASGGPDA